MSVISLFSGSYCGGEEVSKSLSHVLDYELFPDSRLIAMVVDRFGTTESKVRRALYGRPSVFNRFNHERERVVAQYEAVVAETLGRDGLVFQGVTGHLLPPEIAHALKVCLIADMEFRTTRAKATQKAPVAVIAKKLRAEDERLKEWTDYVLHSEPWDPRSYDIVIPVGHYTLEDATELVLENVRKNVVQPTERSIQAVRDFALAARIKVALAEQGVFVGITASEGEVTVTINEHVLMLSRFEANLERIVSAVDGVSAVTTRVGPDFYQSNIYRRQDFEVPSKVLLVDDEQEFAQTLSERLLMRQVGSAIASNGAEALSLVEDDEPEVMVLDLKMPGIDGIEVLRRIKRDHKEVEVIILTGHGSEEDERVCRDLGAFDYLRKPVDIDVLSKAMRAAYRRIRERNELDKEKDSLLET